MPLKLKPITQKDADDLQSRLTRGIKDPTFKWDTPLPHQLLLKYYLTHPGYFIDDYPFLLSVYAVIHTYTSLNITYTDRLISLDYLGGSILFYSPNEVHTRECLNQLSEKEEAFKVWYVDLPSQTLAEEINTYFTIYGSLSARYKKIISNMQADALDKLMIIQ